MHIQMYARHGLEPTSDIRDYVRHRLPFALARVEHHIRQVTVRLRDLNGPKGGVDMHCQVHVQMSTAGVPDVVIEATDSHLQTAVDHALARAARHVVRRLKRWQDGVQGAVRGKLRRTRPDDSADVGM